MRNAKFDSKPGDGSIKKVELTFPVKGSPRPVSEEKRVTSPDACARCLCLTIDKELGCKNTISACHYEHHAPFRTIFILHYSALSSLVVAHAFFSVMGCFGPLLP